MRLLQLGPGDEVSLTPNLTRDLPAYAILSHTWGAEEDEVTFQDILGKSGKSKPGYQKIVFCGKQARANKLDYFWVDSCCIDKTSSAELTESINSMFKWYQNATRCYVFLSDVPTISELLKSKWFTRGWTLQELLAPRTVEFFTSNGGLLGDKRSLENQIHDITKIKIPALRGEPLSGFSVHERMSWTSGRQTTREEDITYCLLGIFDVSLPVIYGEGETNARLRLVGEIDRRLGTPSSVPTKEKSHFLVPFGQNDGFVGRESILQHLLSIIPPKAKVNDCQRTAVEGLGGVGKTQVALEAVYRVYQQFPECSVFWVPAISQVAFENAYRKIGQALHIPGIDDEKADIRALVKAALEQSPNQWLLVIDNIDDPSFLTREISLQCYLPFSYQGSILFTTRNHEVTSRLDISNRNIIRITEMSEAEALSMLKNALQERQLYNEESTKELLQHLAYLPLAIKQASAYMAQTGFSTTKYLEYYGNTDQKQVKFLSRDFTDRRRYPEITNAVLTTWLISFQHISQYSPLAVKLLKFICFLAEKDIPKSILPLGDSKDEIEKDEAIAILEGYAFINQRKDENSFDIHRLVRVAVRNTLKGEDRIEAVTDLVQHLSNIYPYPRHENRSVWMGYMPHVFAAVEASKESTDKDAMWLFLYSVAETYHITTKYEQAEHMYRQALELMEEVLGRDHPSTLEGMNNLANVLDSQGKYWEAEQMHRQTLELREVLGRDHPSTLGSMNNLARVLDSQGKYGEAEQMHRQTLELKKEVLGRDHPSTLRSINNLANVLDSQGKYGEAEQMYRQTLELKEEVLGRDHPSTLGSMNNLARVLDNQGKYGEAEQMQRQTLELTEEVLGRDHPYTLGSMNNLAEALRQQGKYGEAEEMHRQTLGLRKEVLGRDHPDTLDSINNLALVLDSQGKYGEAEQMHRQTLELREEVLGRDHPSTLDSINNLANVLDSQGKYGEAENLHKQALQGYEEKLGPRHPSTLDSMGQVASALQRQGHYAQAESIHQQILTLRKEVLGPDHPDTIWSRNAYQACLNRKDDSTKTASGKSGLDGQVGPSKHDKETTNSDPSETGPSTKTSSRFSRLPRFKLRIGKRS